MTLSFAPRLHRLDRGAEYRENVNNGLLFWRKDRPAAQSPQTEDGAASTHLDSSRRLTGATSSHHGADQGKAAVHFGGLEDTDIFDWPGTWTGSLSMPFSCAGERSEKLRSWYPGAGGTATEAALARILKVSTARAKTPGDPYLPRVDSIPELSNGFPGRRLPVRVLVRKGPG